MQGICQGCDLFYAARLDILIFVYYIGRAILLYGHIV